MASLTVPKITHPFDVQVTLPGSKSIALRQLAIAALTNEPTRLKGLPECDDTAAMLDCLSHLGVTIQGSHDELVLHGPMNLTDDVILDARMSGASARLLIGLAALRSGSTTIDGHASLQARTNQPLFDTLLSLGLKIDSADHGGLPVTLRGPMAINGPICIDGSLSSQYITALLIAIPHIHEDIQINISGRLVSRPYIDITLSEMKKRGIEAAWLDDTSLVVHGAPYAGGSFTVEGDATAATYFAGLATLHGSRVALTNLGAMSRQGDYRFFEIMQHLGASVFRDPSTTKIKGPTNIKPLGTLDMTEMPDAALTLIAMTPMLPGRSTLTGLSSLHHKECDRLDCPARELSQMGVELSTTDDSITVQYKDPDGLGAHHLSTYHDHRMAMAFSLLGSCTGTLTVDSERVVDKTYPAYWDDYRTLITSA